MTKLEEYEAFAETHGYTVDNALQVYIDRMRETAQLSETEMPAAAPVFTESADKAQKALDAWRKLYDPDEPDPEWAEGTLEWALDKLMNDQFGYSRNDAHDLLAYAFKYGVRLDGNTVVTYSNGAYDVTFDYASWSEQVRKESPER